MPLIARMLATAAITAPSAHKAREGLGGEGHDSSGTEEGGAGECDRRGEHECRRVQDFSGHRLIMSLF